MIPIYDTDGSRLEMTYNTHSTINSVSSVESVKSGIEITRIAQASAADFTSEKLQWRDGLDVSGVTKASRLIVMRGYIWGTSAANIADRIATFSGAFDPGRIAFLHPDDPFRPLDFSVPTEDTTNFPTGLAASRVYVMPTEMPVPDITKSGRGLSARFDLTLLAKDPRRYLQTATTSVDGPGDASGSITDIGTYPSYPTLTFSMSGAGSASFSVQNVSTEQGTKSLVLDLSGRSNGQAITVDFANRQVLVNGTATAGIFKSGDWFQIEYGTNTLTYANLTATGTKTMTVYPAFSL
jgi:hypothetical protein